MTCHSGSEVLKELHSYRLETCPKLMLADLPFCIVALTLRSKALESMVLQRNRSGPLPSLDHSDLHAYVVIVAIGAYTRMVRVKVRVLAAPLLLLLRRRLLWRRSLSMPWLLMLPLLFTLELPLHVRHRVLDLIEEE